MSSTPERLRIFISSPGDVAEERALTRRVIERLQGEFAGRADLEPIYWEHEPLRATGSWHEQVFPPAEADIVLCILWSRLGTRQPAEITRPDGSRYESGTEYEFEEAWRAYQERGQPDLLVYRKTREPRVRLRDKSALLERIGQKEALDRFIDTWFQDREEGTLIAAFHPFDSSHDFEELVEIHLRKLIEERLPSTGAVPARRVKVWTEGSPFRGLEAFEFAHAEVFSGRTRATSGLVDALRVQATAAGRPFVLVLGMSGCGKSSLVRAGVLPLLTQPGVIEGVGLWRRAIVRPSDGGGDPFVGLATALLDEHALPELGADGTEPEELARLLRESPEAAFALIKGGLSQAAAEVARAEELTSQPEARLALVVDQMEELFTTEAIGEQDRQRFTEALRALVGSGKIWVLGTLRSDFYPRLAELPALVELKEGGGQYDLLPPDPAEIGQMIRRPAQLAALGFEERETTGERLDDALRDAAARNPEALPLLQFTLEELYKARTGDGVLSFAAYEELGGVEGALAQRAEGVLESLSPKAWAALPVALSRLVRVDAEGVDGATRQRARLEAFPEGSPERAAVDRFVEARLCVTDRDERGTAVVSLAHEALLKHWPRLAEWLERNRELFRMRERLDAAAAQWEAEGRPAASLLASGKRLAEAEELEAAEGIELPGREHAFLQASIAKGRRTRWLKRAAVVALAVLTVLAAAGAWYANQKRAEAEVARGESEAVTDFLSDMLASVDPEELGRDVLVKDVLDEASTKLDELEEQPLIQARLGNTVGIVYQSLGAYDAAVTAFEGALEIQERERGPEDPQVATVLGNLASTLGDKGELEEAQRMNERVLAIREREYGPDHPRVADTVGNLAVVLHEMGDLEGSQSLQERALKIRQEKLGPEAPGTLSSLNNLAVLSLTAGDFDQARDRWQRLLPLHEKVFGAEHPRTVSIMNNLAEVYRESGELERARKLHLRTLEIRERVFGPDHPQMAASHDNLATIAMDQGDFATARVHLERAIAIEEVALGPEHHTLAGTVTNLAILHAITGNLEAALPLFRRVVTLREAALGPEHAQVGAAYHNLGEVLTEMKRFREARPHLERALQIKEAALGPEHPLMFSTLTMLGRVQREVGSPARALPLLERALSSGRTVLGPDHPEVATYARELARTLSLVGKTERVEELFLEALRIQEAAHGPEHPYVAETLEGYAEHLQRTGRDLESAKMESRARAIREALS